MTTTSSFQKYPDYYNSIEDCNLFVKNYNKESSNPRYKNFKQTHFTAGDEEQFRKYICKENGNEKNVDVKDNLFYNKTLFLEWDKYKNLDNLTTINTFKYIFEKFKKGIYVKILNNELKVFLPFSNINFINEWSSNIKVDPKYENIIEFFKYITETEGYTFNKNHINNYPNTWYSNNCLIRYEYPINEGDTNISVIKNMLDELCKNRKLPDIEFFINRRDFPILSKYGYEPYYHLWNSLNKPLISHNYDKYLPILSMSNSENFADILIPTYEDWIRVQNIENKFFPKQRQIYKNVSSIEWKNKKPTAVFRGSSTGEGVTIETNQRLKVAYISSINERDSKNIPYLDAGITKWNLRAKKIIGYDYLQVTDIKNLPFGLLNKLSPLEQSEYKYIVHIDGHVSAFRLSYELSLNSVILLVKSKWKSWLNDMIKPYIHYVPVKEDLSDLIDQIKWCRDNDEKCIEIINNAKMFYDTYLQKNGIFDYFEKLFSEIKKTTGIYFNNTLTNLNIQNMFQTDFLLKKKYINIKDIDSNNIEDINRIPYIKRAFPLFCALQKILNYLNINSTIEDKLIKKDVIFSNKLSTIIRAEHIDFNYIIKSTKNKDKLYEHVNEVFIGINAINKIIKDIPNFAFIFDCYENKTDGSFNIISEYISDITFQGYIMSNTFKFSEFLNILLQICLALEVAQENCCFVHNDLTPWNICLKYLDEPTYIDYKIQSKVISIKANIIPVIIDYGKAHVIYQNQHYGNINIFKFSRSFDMLSIFITSIYQVITSQLLQKNDFINILKLSNFISNTKYRNNKFKSLNDIKSFFYSAKKYTNLINTDKYELENYTPLKLFNYITENLKFNQTIKYNTTFKSSMNIGNSDQIIKFIFASSDKYRIKSFTNVFKNIKNIKLDDDIHPLFLINTKINLEKTLLDTYEDFKYFCNKEGIKNISKYIRYFNDALNHLHEIKLNYKNIYFDLKYDTLSLDDVTDYNEDLFLSIDKMYIKLEKNIIIKQKIDIDMYNLLIIFKDIIDNIFLSSNTKINKKYFFTKYENILCLDKIKILNKIANINSLEYHSKILYNNNILKLNNNLSDIHLTYYKQLKEIINILG